MAARFGRHGAVTALGLALVAAVGGCAADDPREGGFLGGVMGLLSGQYDRNVEARRARLDGLEAERRRFDDDGQRLSLESGELRAVAVRRKEAAAAMAAHTAGLEAEIHELRRARRAAERARADPEAGGIGGGEPPSGAPAAAEAGPAAPQPRADVAGLLEQVAELEAELGALQAAAARNHDERARLREEIERLNDDVTRSRASSPEAAEMAPEG